MDKPSSSSGPSKREVYESTLRGEQTNQPFIPHLRSDPETYHPLPHSLVEFRKEEGRAERKRKLLLLWKRTNERIPSPHNRVEEGVDDKAAGRGLTLERARILDDEYEQELLGQCQDANGSSSSKRTHIDWKEFKEYALAKEAGMSLFLCNINFNIA